MEQKEMDGWQQFQAWLNKNQWIEIRCLQGMLCLTDLDV
jgi:hypothetical protein